MKTLSWIIVALSVSAIPANARTIYLDQLDKSLDSRWNALDNICRGDPGGSDASNAACDQRLILDKIIIKKGCVNIYPATGKNDTSYWRCTLGRR